ncbi:hypothetical protein BP00DRAFT_87524 [Aspergillus indologenus CBS 114.80]|uniref:Uncharacterized protein n=1 Tax=Aspergillus indologenus CBS 114.80 TaxID=1450541 RepID=A0A2V5IPC0_9EURO|nr:hypothetical protein BP00DRAFT_87524 [Aspergillus indologenus CBS 114.80]
MTQHRVGFLVDPGLDGVSIQFNHFHFYTIILHHLFDFEIRYFVSERLHNTRALEQTPPPQPHQANPEGKRPPVSPVCRSTVSLELSARSTLVLCSHAAMKPNALQLPLPENEASFRGGCDWTPRRHIAACSPRLDLRKNPRLAANGHDLGQLECDCQWRYHLLSP